MGSGSEAHTDGGAGTASTRPDSPTSALFWALHDDTSRLILTKTTERARTVKELAAISDVSMNTVYRRVRKLAGQGLLHEKHRLDDDGFRYTAYRAAISRVEVVLAGDTLETHIEREDPPNDNATRAWNSISR